MQTASSLAAAAFFFGCALALGRRSWGSQRRRRLLQRHWAAAYLDRWLPGQRGGGISRWQTHAPSPPCPRTCDHVVGRGLSSAKGEDAPPRDGAQSHRSSRSSEPPVTASSNPPAASSASSVYGSSAASAQDPSEVCARRAAAHTRSEARIRKYHVSILVCGQHRAVISTNRDSSDVIATSRLSVPLRY